MKIGAYLVIKNEQENICRVVRYHLDIQHIDLILLVDNGSTDGTLQQVAGMNDSRVIVRKTRPDTGFRQDVFSTMAARELFLSYACDWVLPVDADEYWHSINFGSVRNALERIVAPVHGILTAEYRFYESARDNPTEPLFLKRLLHARTTHQRKAVLHDLGASGFTMEFGNHAFTFENNTTPICITMEPADLARFHYPHINRADLIKRTLNQVEGFILRTHGTWLSSTIQNRLGGHIWDRYLMLRAGTLEQYYTTHYYLTEQQLETELQNGSVQYIDAMLRLLEVKTL